MESKASIELRLISFVITFVMLAAVILPTTNAWAEEEAPLLQVEPTDISLKVGEKKTLQINKKDTVVWSTSDHNVASVSAGSVTAVGPGTATITAALGEEAATCTVTVYPNVPTSVKAKTAGISSIYISWKSVQGVSGYKVYRASSKGGTYKQVATTGKTQYKDTKRTTGKRYYYKVKAYKSSYYSNSSKWSSAKAAPLAPRAKTKSKPLKIQVRWNKVKGASGYKIYRATSKKGKYKAVKTIKKGKTTTYTDGKYKVGKKFYYKVKAYRTVGKKRVYGAASPAISGKAGKTKLKYNKKHRFYYKKKMKVKAYAYTGGGRTATGTRARVGEIAVDPRVIPLKSKVYVNGYGHAKAEDTGGNIKGKTIDVYLNSGSACSKWGVKHPTVYVGIVKVKK